MALRLGMARLLGLPPRLGMGSYMAQANHTQTRMGERQAEAGNRQRQTGKAKRKQIQQQKQPVQQQRDKNEKRQAGVLKHTYKH